MKWRAEEDIVCGVCGKRGPGVVITFWWFITVALCKSCIARMLRAK